MRARASARRVSTASLPAVLGFTLLALFVVALLTFPIAACRFAGCFSVCVTFSRSTCTFSNTFTTFCTHVLSRFTLSRFTLHSAIHIIITPVVIIEKPRLHKCIIVIPILCCFGASIVGRIVLVHDSAQLVGDLL